MNPLDIDIHKANAVWTASGNNLGNATSNVEFATLFNTASPYSLVGYWDYGSAITVAATETFIQGFDLAGLRADLSLIT